ncbi:MAG: NUDIX domain-containing protein [Actinomyces sp.]|uniref:NUDIX domain-containing protein n=1 Tax=Actinomyces sp. TaxID=29317 RepID=UPI0026DC14D7|nr:NUDIX domain-containing protein [Actinomyces sp.]MDO4243962.1 NUDIX domain-containing protein [Actinomyces sp.]
MQDRAQPRAPRTPGRLVVAAAVLDSMSTPSSLLCTARSYPAEHAGQYELPGGKVEPDETPLAALARELTEELELVVRTGAEITPPAPLAVLAPPTGAAGDNAPAWPVLHGFRMRVWLAEPAGSVGTAGLPPRGAAHAEVRWVPLGSVLDLPWLPADLPILEEILRRTTAEKP